MDKPSDSPPAPTEGSCEPLPNGACEEQADCAEGLECAKPTGVVDCPSAPPGGEAPECESGEVTSRYGYCSLPEMPCSADSECMLGLSCVSGVSGGGSSGGSTGSGGSVDPVDPTPAPKPVDKDGSGDGVCVYEPKSCDNGEACPDGFECAEVDAGGTCTSTACPDGVACDEPPEPECETLTQKLCVPKLIPCSDTAPCEEHWTCTELTTDGSGIPAPESWEASGPVKSCLPEGLALAAEAGQAGSLSSNDVASDAPREQGGAGEGTSSEESADDDGAKGADSSSVSCSVTHRTGAQRALGALFTLGVMGLVVRRRRRKF